MPFITIHSQPFHYSLRRSDRARRLILRVIPQGFEIVAPLRVTNKEALQFLWQQQNWMYRQQQYKTKRQNTANEWKWPEVFLAQETIPYRGARLLLQVKFAQKPNMVQLGNSLIVTVPWHKTLLGAVDKTVKQMIMKWYQQQASILIQKTLEHYCPALGRWPNGFDLKLQKTRWGSCGIAGKIHINWLLVLAPVGMLEYVVIHELCHLFHRNHGKRFWDKVAKCLPDYQYFDKWLNKMGQCLPRPI